MEIKQYTKELIPDILQFERDLRSEENFWGWEIDEKYIADVTASFDSPAFANSLSLLAYMDGKVVGKHKGLIHYTVGQRKGLGISLGKPAFVYGVDPEKNQVRLCDNQALFQTKLYAGSLAHMAYEKFEDGMRFQAKIRYAHKAAWCTVKMIGEDILEATFDEPQRAITPGQSLVLYDGEYVAGGGFVLPENAVKKV